ncbi:methylated-DNA--[protein]-cysteine S-methyltransferase [Phycicoccus sp.]|uniref:methylated-DNA--[protein]-cysteine S-methyltransferase n=1 Tax=Phycicoccus sp. TaxID=1902410 RepID=UPI002BAC5913|nr:methylated-DNA--[protein]-cysteine S-methyltransferase [Phycicoccus sp.]HMM95436.1 methylated-DNA--[protein]-cysteine S-methyltransferase [Phycicoccus sp.]
MRSETGGALSLVVPSPVGGLGLVEADGALVAIHFDAVPVPEERAPAPSPLLEEVRTQLEQYFRGERRVFDLPVRPRGTAFRQRVWEVLATVPWGTTTTYGAIADRLGLPPGASRAVGAANGANPVPIVLPCHRVVGADGTLTGYAGGLERKAALLRLEGVPTEADQAVLF